MVLIWNLNKDFFSLNWILDGVIVYGLRDKILSFRLLELVWRLIFYMVKRMLCMVIGMVFLYVI